MKFKTHGIMQSTPRFKMNARVEPVNFDTRVSGSFDAEVSSISVTIDAVLIRLAIPFMKPRCKLPKIASIGGFKIKLAPFRIKVEEASLHLHGVLGTKGIKGEMDTQVACKTKVEMEGELCGKVGTVELNLGNEYNFDEKKEGQASQVVKMEGN